MAAVEDLQPTLAVLPTLSSMLLRVAVALWSVREKSQGVLLQGAAFACLTRCLADGVLAPCDGWEVKCAMVVTAALRELAHMYGLRVVFQRCYVCLE
mmetsp:Transcript_11969/g.34998  ORF Transcript_11969/g.34998 Transcript_11969/m.34998 type:complete len:97 (+) Transcript_11969:43-333(+)